MTKEQSKAEMRYRPGKYVLKVLLDAEDDSDSFHTLKNPHQKHP